MKAKVAHKGGKHHNLTRSDRHKNSGKYVKQAGRTANNKEKHIRKARKLKIAADKRKAGVAHFDADALPFD